MIRIPDNVLKAIENQKREVQAAASNAITANKNAIDTKVNRSNNSENKQWMYYVGTILLIIMTGFIVYKVKRK